MDTKEIIELAEHYLKTSNATMKSSAECCIADAKKLLKSNPRYAGLRALKALAYLIGITHPHYICAKWALNDKPYWVLKIFNHPKNPNKGFQVLQCDWNTECKAETCLPPEKGCSSMSQHDSKQEAYDHAKKILGEDLFNRCF